MNQSYPTSQGTLTKLQVGQFVSHSIPSSHFRTIHSIITSLTEDGFETREYSCGRYLTEVYSYDSIVEVVHNGVDFENSPREGRDCYYIHQANQSASQTAEFLMRVDNSLHLPASIGTQVHIFTHTTEPDAEIVNIYHFKTSLKEHDIYIVKTKNSVSYEHKLRNQFVVCP